MKKIRHNNVKEKLLKPYQEIKKYYEEELSFDNHMQKLFNKNKKIKIKCLETEKYKIKKILIKKLRYRYFNKI